MTFCLNPNSYYSRTLIETIGEKAAYHVVHLNNGHDITKAPNGVESNLFNELQRYTGSVEKAMELKSKFYTKRFRDTYGDWLNHNQKYSDINGEPKFSEFVDKMDLKTQVENVAGDHSSNQVEDLYEVSKATYSPILNKLQAAYNLPWSEDNTLDGAGAFIDGKVTVNFASITPDAAFHEYAHPIVLYVKNIDPSAYNRLIAEARRNDTLVKEVTGKYKHLSASELNDEIVTTVLGKYAIEAHQLQQTKGLWAAVRQFLDSVAKIFDHILGLKKQFTREDLTTLNLREIGFLMGTVTPKLDLGTLQSTFDNLKSRGTVVNGKVRLEVPSQEIVNGYRDILGWENVEITKRPKMGTGNFTIEVSNPIDTNGQKLLKMKAAAETPAGPKYASTKEGFLDDLVKVLDEKINTLRNQLRGKLDKSTQKRYNSQVRFYSSLINDFYSTTNSRLGIEVVTSEVDRLGKMLDKKLSITELESAVKMLNGFDIIDTYFNKFNTSGTFLKTVEAVKSDISVLRNAYTDKWIKAVKDEMIVAGVSESVAATLTDPAKDISAISLQTIGSSFGQNATEQAGDYLVRKSAFDGNEEVRAFNGKLDEMASKFNGNYSFVLTRDADGNAIPITKMNREFLDKVDLVKKGINETTKLAYEKRKEIRELEKELSQAQIANSSREVQEAIYNKIKDKRNEVTTINITGKTWNDYHRMMQEHFDYNLSEDGKNEYEEFIKDRLDSFIKIDENGNEFFDEKGYKREVDLYNPDHFQSYLEGKRKLPNAGAMWFEMTPKAGSTTRLYSKEYQALSKDQKEFYDFFTETFHDSSNTIYTDFFNDDLNMDAAIREFVSMPVEQRDKMKYSEAVSEWFKDLLVVPEGSNETDTYGVFSKINRKNIKFKSVQAYMDPKKSLSDQDIVSVLKKYHAASVAFKYRKNVEDILNSTAEIAFHAGKKDTSNMGDVKKDIFGNEKTTPATTNVYKRLRHTIDNYLYGDTKEHTKGDKIVDMINEFTRLRQMGLNPFSGFSNLAMGTINNWTYAKRGEFFNEKDLRKAYWRLKSSIAKTGTLDKFETGEAKKIALLADKFGVHDKLMEKHLKNKLLDKMYVFQERGEYLNHMSTILASLENEKMSKGVVDKNGNKKTLYDVFKVQGDTLILDSENFNLEAIGMNDKKVFNIIQGLNKVNKEIHGDYDPLNPMYLKRTSFGRLISTFRTWLPQAIHSRLSAEYKDEQLSAMMGEDVMRKGRYRSVGTAIAKGGVKGNLRLAGNFLAGFVPFVDGKVGPMDQLGDHDIANINQTLSEARILALISLLIACMGHMGGDDKDKDKKVFNFFYNMSNRMENELSFFYYPSNGYKLFKDFIPAVDTFTQMGKVSTRLLDWTINPANDIYKTGFRKGHSKFWKEVQILTPGLKQVQSAWSVVSQQYNNNSNVKR